MNEQTKHELDAVDQRTDEILARIEQLAGNLDEETFELIEPDLMACLETMAIAGELSDLAALVESEESTAVVTAPAAEAPADDKDGNSFFSFLTQLFSGFPETVVNLIANDKKVAVKDAQKPEGDCCVDVEEPCMAKDNAQPAEGEQASKKLPLAEEPQITICIAPSTSDYFKDMKPTNSDSKDTKDGAKSDVEGQPVGKLRPSHPEDQLGLKDGLGAKAASMIVMEDSYEVSEPTIDSHIVKLKATGADVFVNITTPKFAAQAIKKNAELGWKPTHFLNNVSASIGSVIKPAGFENAQGIISSNYLKDPTDSQWKNDQGMKNWNAFLDKYYPEANRADASVMYGYTVAQGLVEVLKACGDNLTRENVMKQAASLKDLQLEGLLPGIKVNTSATDFAPISQIQLQRFKGENWELFGDILSSDTAG